MSVHGSVSSGDGSLLLNLLRRLTLPGPRAMTALSEDPGAPGKVAGATLFLYQSKSPSDFFSYNRRERKIFKTQPILKDKNSVRETTSAPSRRTSPARDLARPRHDSDRFINKKIIPQRRFTFYKKKGNFREPLRDSPSVRAHARFLLSILGQCIDLL